MTDDLVIYKNKLNEYFFDGKISESEQTILFTLFKEAKEKNTDVINLSYKKFKAYVETMIKRTSSDAFYTTLKKLGKLEADSIKETSDNSRLMYFNFFDYIIADQKKDFLEIKLTTASMYLFNDITPPYTCLNLKKFNQIQGKYNRIIYRNLKSFESTGIWLIDYIEFKKELCIPQTYRATDINRQILDKAIKELSSHFKNLKIDKIKEGKTIKKLVFTFDKKPISKAQKIAFNEFQNLTNGEKAKYNYDYEEYLQEKNQTFEEIQPTRDPNKLFE